jgi:multicomponent K+:H+ antiporter subunit A
MLMLAAGGVVRWHRRRFNALVFTSLIGLIVALCFVRFSAPDLALTQLAVEVVTIVLMLLALHYLPPISPAEDRMPRIARDAALALTAGLGLGTASYAMLTSPFETISGFYLGQAVPGAGGRNAVNVILVDFRAFDTLGEISVLAMVGLAARALLDPLVLEGPSRDAEGRPWSAERHPLFLEMLMRPLLPLALMVSVYIFLRGHHLPGGGFIAGLVTAIALIMQYLAHGATWTHERLPPRTHPWIAAGLAVALLTGLGSVVFDRAFLSSTFGHLDWPIVGRFELASAMAFDLGVYLVVVGATLLILINLGLAHRASHETGSR